MMPSRAADAFGSDRIRGSGSKLWSSSPCDQGIRPHTAICLAVTLLLTSLSPVEALEPLKIGVLALGPRNLPRWNCDPIRNQQRTIERPTETMPFYVLGLLEQLKNLGYLEDRIENAGRPGRRFTVDVKMGTSKEVENLAREFVSPADPKKRMDIIVAVATAGAKAAQKETQEIPVPIVFPGISNPVGDGLVKSLAQPGGNITGVSHQQVQASAKRVELFKQMLPALQRLITIRWPNYEPSEDSIVEVRAAAERLKIDILDWTVTTREELQELLKKVRKETADGIMILPDSLVISNLDLVLETSLEQRVPTFGLQDFMADWGALAAYGPSSYKAGVQVAHYVDKIAKGVPPGDIPVEPLDPIIVINKKTAACLGISIPQEVMGQIRKGVDRAIE